MLVNVGDRYSRLVVLESGASLNQHRTWKCQCDCGTTCVVREDKLRSGKTKSCGCLRNQLVVEQRQVSDEAQQKKEIADCLRETRKNLLLAERLLNRTAGQHLQRNSGIEFNPTAILGVSADDVRRFEKTGTPNQIADLLEFWTEIVTEILRGGSENTEITVSVNLSKTRPKYKIE